MKLSVILALTVPVTLSVKWILKKFNIPKATVSRAQVIYKRVWGEPGKFVSSLLMGGQSLEKLYYITFLYMIDNKWVEAEFRVSKKVYTFSHAGDEGILRHDYTEFRDFEKFKK